ncbi:acyltransferase family protein [Trueperella pecoris]|uniref:Acyltransferase n=1 Tax=Trueperella pecoris TaxID=2733571 RepID=A0A7M1QUP6_9ACTO|nr:acyltransferase family protein [Trueperella pecoris]QOR45719.1 acyltransferase [Trueperella pecoris]
MTSDPSALTSDTPAEAPETTRASRIRGLDGLRALGALFVLVFHLLPDVGGAGFIGVDVFFVISGFLITALLLKEHDATGRIDLPSFLRRRYRRLLPAVAAMVVVAVGLGRLIADDAVVQARWQTFGALTGTYNWFQIANGSSYFEAQEPLLLTNMWSLAVEQQFYLAWPMVVMALVLARRRWRLAAAGLIGTLSVVLHVWLASEEITRAYVGTDTHIFGLMIGAGIAFALPGVLAGRPRNASHWWGKAAWVALAGLAALTFMVPDGGWFYPWGLLLASVLAGVVVRGILPDVQGMASERLSNALESAPMVWIGRRSYGIYLWHWPLWVLATYHLNIGEPLSSVGVIILTILTADLSYTYVETPIRRLGVLGWLRSARRLSPIATAWLAAGTLLIAGAFGNAIVTSKDMTEAQALVAAGSKLLGAEPGADPTTPAETTTPTPTPTPITGDRVTIIGDSVTLAAAPALLETLPQAVVDGQVSRSAHAFESIANVYQSQGKLRDVVVISLATNGVIPLELAHDIMNYLGPDRKVVWVTANAPRAAWVPEANATIRSLAAEYPDRVRVADWEPIAKAHPELLSHDGIHPNPQGSKLYAAEVKRAIDSF